MIKGSRPPSNLLSCYRCKLISAENCRCSQISLIVGLEIVKVRIAPNYCKIKNWKTEGAPLQCSLTPGISSNWMTVNSRYSWAALSINYPREFEIELLSRHLIAIPRPFETEVLQFREFSLHRAMAHPETLFSTTIIPFLKLCITSGAPLINFKLFLYVKTTPRATRHQVEDLAVSSSVFLGIFVAFTKYFWI